MNKPINELIVLLDQLMDLQDKEHLLTEDTTEYFTDIGHLAGNDAFNGMMEKILILLDNNFITPEGHADHNRIGMLKTISNSKYSIERGEYDSFSWLSGVLITPRGKIVYG